MNATGKNSDTRSAEGRADSRSLKGVYLGVDATNPTLILRIGSFLRAGVDLTAFTFRRHKFNTDFQPQWRNVHLGATRDRNYLRRVPALLRAVWTLWQHRETIRKADFIYCRNIDLLALGLVARRIAGRKPLLVYEVEDVQEVFFKRTLSGRIFRKIEAWALRRTDLLVPLSPGFLHGYFEPVHGYDGPSYVLENRIQPADLSKNETPAGRLWEPITDRWVIGWFGTLRCPKSMKILEAIADRMGDRVEIYTRGYPTETGIEAYRDVVERHPNWTYDGEYTIPHDLEAMYGRVHFSWCLDFLDEDGNSPLLLACRMYQGSYFGAVPLVVKGWEMDRWLTPHGFGHAFEAPYVDSICEFLEGITQEAYVKERARILSQRDLFLEDGRDMSGLLDMIQSLSSRG